VKTGNAPRSCRAGNPPRSSRPQGHRCAPPALLSWPRQRPADPGCTRLRHGHHPRPPPARTARRMSPARTTTRRFGRAITPAAAACRRALADEGRVSSVRDGWSRRDFRLLCAEQNLGALLPGVQHVHPAHLLVRAAPGARHAPPPGWLYLEEWAGGRRIECRRSTGFPNLHVRAMRGTAARAGRHRRSDREPGNDGRGRRLPAASAVCCRP